MATDVDRARGVGHRLCRAGGHVARVPPQIARRQRHRRAAQGVFIRDPERHRHDQDPGARTALAVALAPLYRRGGGQDLDARPYRGTRPQRDHEPRTRHERRHRRARRAVRAQRQDDGRRADRLQHAGFAAGAAADPGLGADAGVPKGGAVAETLGAADADQARAGERPAGAHGARAYRIRGCDVSLPGLGDTRGQGHLAHRSSPAKSSASSAAAVRARRRSPGYCKGSTGRKPG